MRRTLRNKASAYYKTKNIKLNLIGDGKDRGVCENCIMDENGLKSDLVEKKVFDEFIVSGRFFDVRYAHANKTILACADDGVYKFAFGKDEKFVKMLDGKREPCALIEQAEGDFYSAYYLFGGEALMICADGIAPVQIPLFASDACAHFGRVFYIDAINPYKIGWSKNGVLDWEKGIDGSGELTLDAVGGRAIRVLSVGERLVIMREYAINVFHALGSPEHFRMEAQEYFTEKILAKTCAVDGGSVYFATESGLFRFGTRSIERLTTSLDGDFTQVQDGVVCWGKYALSCYSVSLNRYAILIYDVDTKSAYYVCLPVENLFAGDFIYAFFDGDLYKLDGVKGDKNKLYSLDYVAGDGKRRRIKTLVADCGKNIKIKVICDGVEKVFLGGGVHKVDMYADKFTVEIFGEGKIKNLYLTCEVANGI